MKFNNELLYNRWIKLILSVYNGDIYYQTLRNSSKSISGKEAIKILSNQINLLKSRNIIFNNMTIDDFTNFTKMSNILLAET